MGEDEDVKRPTAVRHLVEMAEVASENLRLRSTEIGWPLEELWAAGHFLGSDESFDAGSVVVVLDLPPEEVPWLAVPPAGAWVAERLRLGKRPLYWCYRPRLWPAWNHHDRRVVRVWSASAGLDDGVIEALRSGRLHELAVVEPSGDELVDQLDRELAESRRHLRAVLDRYWEQDWRREHRGYDESPEDHLWRAARAVSEIADTLNPLQI